MILVYFSAKTYPYFSSDEEWLAYNTRNRARHCFKLRNTVPHTTNKTTSTATLHHVSRRLFEVCALSADIKGTNYYCGHALAEVGTSIIVIEGESNGESQKCAVLP